MPRNITDIKNLIFGNSLGRKHANYFYPGSMLDSLASDVAQLVVGAESDYRSNISNSFISTAGPRGLERIANDFGISRRMDTVARVLESDRNILISSTYNENIVDVLSDYNILLNGLQISDASDTKRYILQQTNPIDANAKSVYVGAIANGSGSSFNVEKGKLIRFVKSYPRLMVTNTAAIRSGQDMESDETLRVKIFTKIESNQKNINSLSYYLNQLLPDLGMSYISGNSGGSSGLYVYVQPLSGAFYEESYLSNVSFELSNFMGPGQLIRVNNFVPSIFNFEITAIVKPGVDIGAVNEQIQYKVVSYFNNLKGGQSVELSFLKTSIANIPGIKLLSRTNNSFKKVTYDVRDGSAYFTYDATLEPVISLNPEQLATVGNIVLSVTNE